MLIENTGIFMYNEEHPHSEKHGSAALGILECTPLIKGMWFRSEGWFDAVSKIWREVINGTFEPNDQRLKNKLNPFFHHRFIVPRI